MRMPTREQTFFSKTNLLESKAQNAQTQSQVMRAHEVNVDQDDTYCDWRK